MPEAPGSVPDFEGEPRGRWIREAMPWLRIVVLVLLLVAGGAWLAPRIRWYRGLSNPSLNARNIDPRGTKVWVWNAERGPVPGGAIVELRRPGHEEPLLRTSTAFNGGVDVKLPEGVADWGGLEVVALHGPLVARQALVGHPGESVTLDLPVSAQLRGRLVPSKPGLAMEGWTVSWGASKVPTDADGRFRLGVVPRPAAPRDPIVVTAIDQGGRQHRFPMDVPWTDEEHTFTVEE